jgi:hypothetical protein
MSKVKLDYKIIDGDFTHLVWTRPCQNLDQAWKEMVDLCGSICQPIPTEEDYRAGRLTKTIIQE